MESKAPDEQDGTPSQSGAVPQPTANPDALRRPANASEARSAPPRLRGLLEPNDLEAGVSPVAPAAWTAARPGPSSPKKAATGPPTIPRVPTPTPNGATMPPPSSAPPPLPPAATSPPVIAPPVVRPAAPPSDHLRRQEALLLVLALVAAAGVLGLVALVATIVADSAPDLPRAVPSSTARSTLPERTEPVVTTAPGGGERGSPVDGLAVAAAVVSPTMIEVLEMVRWPDGGPATIELALSSDAASAGGLAIMPNPTVESLQVSVDGSPVTPTLRAGSTNAWVITPPSGAAPRTMEVRYVLTGAIVRSLPSAPGRALAVLSPISTGAVGDLPTTIAISTTDVLNVYCPTAVNQAAIMCGRLDGDRWTITPPPGLPVVVAQIDLPMPA